MNVRSSMSTSMPPSTAPKTFGTKAKIAIGVGIAAGVLVAGVAASAIVSSAGAGVGAAR